MYQRLLMMAMGSFIFFAEWTWYKVVILVAGLFVAFVAHIVMNQETILYVPCVMAGMHRPSDNPKGMRSPEEISLRYEDVYMTTSDGVRTHAWFIMAPPQPEEADVSPESETPAEEVVAPGRPTILFCHANAGNIGLRLPNFAAIVEKLQANIFAFDYRGYGNSEGTPSEEGLIEDALTAWAWLEKKAKAGEIDGGRIFVFGRSLGGAVAVALASALEREDRCLRPQGLMLENTFVSISAMVDSMFPFLASKRLKDIFLRIKWETIERIQPLETPMLFLTGGRDEIVPSWHSEKLRKSAGKSRLLRSALFPEGMHNDTWEAGGEKYWEAMSGFFKACLENESTGKEVET